MPENFNVLKDILDDFQQEIKVLDTDIERQQQSIKEIDTYVTSLTEAETEDFRVFSPRKAEVIYKEELAEARERKAICEAQVERLGKRRELLTEYTERLTAVLAYVEQEQKRQLQSKEAMDIQKDFMENLAYLAERIEKVSDDIMKKPVQARQDLAVIARDIRDITDGYPIPVGKRK